jgi:hypothetical protein
LQQQQAVAVTNFETTEMTFKYRRHVIHNFPIWSQLNTRKCWLPQPNNATI